MAGKLIRCLLVLLISLFVLPIIFICSGSVVNQRFYGFSLEAYVNLLFKGNVFLPQFWYTFAVSLAIGLLNSMISLFSAYLFFHPKFRTSKPFYFFYAFFTLVPYQATALPNYLFAKASGIYDTPWALILPCAFAPLGVFILVQFAKQIPKSYVEAALLDTSSAIKVLFCIVAPCLRQGLAALFVISFAQAWNMVEQPLILIETERLYPLSVSIHRIAGTYLPERFAASVIYALPVFFLYLFFEEELHAGLSRLKL